MTTVVDPTRQEVLKPVASEAYSSQKQQSPSKIIDDESISLDGKPGEPEKESVPQPQSEPSPGSFKDEQTVLPPTSSDEFNFGLTMAQQAERLTEASIRAAHNRVKVGTDRAKNALDRRQGEYLNAAANSREAAGQMQRGGITGIVVAAGAAALSVAGGVVQFKGVTSGMGKNVAAARGAKLDANATATPPDQQSATASPTQPTETSLPASTGKPHLSTSTAPAPTVQGGTSTGSAASPDAAATNQPSTSTAPETPPATQANAATGRAADTGAADTEGLDFDPRIGPQNRATVIGTALDTGSRIALSSGEGVSTLLKAEGAMHDADAAVKQSQATAEDKDLEIAKRDSEAAIKMGEKTTEFLKNMQDLQAERMKALTRASG